MIAWIHQLINKKEAYVLIGLSSFVFLVIGVWIFRVRNKPMVLMRSPYLMIMINLGLLGDTILKILIAMKPFTEISSKCSYSIFRKIIFHYIVYFSIIGRMDRVIKFYKIFKEAYDNYKIKNAENEKSFEISSRKYMKGILREVHMQREGRVITNIFVNIIVPITMVGFTANYISWALLYVPIEEQDVCWFYYLNRSPVFTSEIS